MSNNRAAGIVALNILPAIYDAGVGAEILGTYRWSVWVVGEKVASFETSNEARQFCKDIISQLPAAAEFQGHYTVGDIK